jgi:hypothetical protein
MFDLYRKTCAYIRGQYTNPNSSTWKNNFETVSYFIIIESFFHINKGNILKIGMGMRIFFVCFTKIVYFFYFRFPSSLGALFVSTTNFKLNMNFLHQFIFTQDLYTELFAEPAHLNPHGQT